MMHTRVEYTHVSNREESETGPTICLPDYLSIMDAG